MLHKLSTVVLASALAACAAYPGAAPNAPDRAKLATIELKPSIDQAYIIDDFEKQLKLQNHFTPNAALDAAALATDGGTSLVLLSLSVMSGDDAQDIVSKYAFPESVNGQALSTKDQVNNIVSELTVDAAVKNGFELIEMSPDHQAMLFRADAAEPLYLRVYNFGARKMDNVPPHMAYAWSFPPAWVARMPASFSICWGTEIAKNADGSFKTGKASDGRELPLVDCERSIPDSVSKTIQHLTATGYFVYANKGVRVNRLYFEGTGYNPYW